MHQRKTADEVRDRVEKRMAVIDSLTPAQRAVVHEFGWGLVKLFRDCGITNPKTQVMLINRVLYELNNSYHEMATTNRVRPTLTRG